MIQNLQKTEDIINKVNDYELDSSGKLVKKLYGSNRQRQKKLLEALED